ncbi:MAG TPA: GAF domain-containing sensor histidine kinase, partial [Labilithrix sp.]
MEDADARQLALLYELACGVARAESTDGVLDASLATVCRALDVERASILLVDDGASDGAMRFRAWRGLSDEYRAAVDGHSPWKSGAVDPQPIVVSDSETDPAMEPYRAIFRAEGIRALAFVPLVHERKLIGKFMIYGGEPRVLAPAEVRLALTIASHVAEAVARQAAQDAEREAARARETLLAVVAHDLRNPLNVVHGRLQILHRRAREDDARTRSEIESMMRSSNHMARLISDLLDVAAIDARLLSIVREAHVASELVDEVLEVARDLAERHGTKLEVASRLKGEKMMCDRTRFVQVFSNLLGNAMKFSPKGGVVTIEAFGEPEHLSFAVADEGPGIAAAEHARVFEAWTRLRDSRSPTAKKNGTGLGLYIARGLVRAHGGRIWIDPHASRG